MIRLELGDELYSWRGSPEILDEKYFKVRNLDKLHFVELQSNSELNGVVLIGKISVIVDSVIYTRSHGAIGETTEFIGSSLAILGLELADVQESLYKVNGDSNETEGIWSEANKLIYKLRKSLTKKETKIQIDNDSDVKYIIFGKSNLFLLGSTDNFVLIHKKKISVRKGENSLVQVDPHDGITIATEDRCIRLGTQKDSSDLSFLGDLGVNIASKVLDSIVWD